MEEKARIAIIGVGGWGKNHVRVLHDIGVLRSICDTDINRAKLLAEKYDVNYELDWSCR